MAAHSDSRSRPFQPLGTTRLAFAGALALAIVLGGCGGGARDELVIGEYGSLTGGEATFGQSTRTGVEIALEELAATRGGRIGGLPVRVVVEDDQGKPEEAASVVQKLVNQDRVVAMIGEVASSRSLAGGPICQQNQVPMISPSSTNPKVTQIGSFVFRMCYLDDFQGAVIARWTADSLGLRRVAVMKDVRNDYSVALARFIESDLARVGAEVVIEQSYSSGDQDFRAQLTAIKAKGPQAIVLPGYYTEVGLIARQARELGIHVPIVGGDGWESEKLLEIGGDALDGCYYTSHWAFDQPNPNLQAFLAAYRGRFHSDPDAIAGLAYDAASVLFRSIEQLATRDPRTFRALGSSKAGGAARKAAESALRDILAATTNHLGVTGTITMDPDRNPRKPIVVIAVRGGRKTAAATIH